MDTNYHNKSPCRNHMMFYLSYLGSSTVKRIEARMPGTLVENKRYGKKTNSHAIHFMILNLRLVGSTFKVILYYISSLFFYHGGLGTKVFYNCIFPYHYINYTIISSIQ